MPAGFTYRRYRKSGVPERNVVGRPLSRDLARLVGRDFEVCWFFRRAGRAFFAGDLDLDQFARAECGASGSDFIADSIHDAILGQRGLFGAAEFLRRQRQCYRGQDGEVGSEPRHTTGEDVIQDTT